MYTNRTKTDILYNVEGPISYSKKVAHNTVKYIKNNIIYIRYHYTDVVVLYPDGTVKLNSNGFRTVTTKKRMNTYQNIGTVSQSNWEWYILTSKGKYNYKDNVILLPNGTVSFIYDLYEQSPGTTIPLLQPEELPV